MRTLKYQGYKNVTHIKFENFSAMGTKDKLCCFFLSYYKIKKHFHMYD